MIRYIKRFGPYKKPYLCVKKYRWFSYRYGKTVTIEEGDESDGATGAWDIHSSSWWIHDKLCERTTWDDGTPVTAFKAAMTLRDVLLTEGRWFRANIWFVATFIGGCKKVRKNGWFHV